MAAAAAAGLTPAETAFVAEMEQVTVQPRQGLASMELLGGTTPALRPPARAELPLWLALLLRRQGRANIVPPPWLAAPALEDVLAHENAAPGFAPPPDFPAAAVGSKSAAGSGSAFPSAPPFQPSCTALAAADALPYHWLEVAQLLLDGAADDVPDADAVRRLLRDLREARAAKLRAGLDNLDGAREVVLRGVGALEVAEQRAFVGAVVDGLRTIGASREAARREADEERRAGGGGGYDDDEDDEDML